MARIFKTPFGAQGDTEQVPEAPQGDGSVSLTQGFGYDYEREYEDPAAKDIRREVMNGLFHDVTEAIGDIQLSGVAKWSADAAPYPAGAVVWHNNNAWRSMVGNNSAAPTEGANWSAVVSQNDSRLSDAREWAADTVSQAEAQAGTATTRRAWTAQRVRQAIAGWWSGVRANDLTLQSSIPQVPDAGNVQEALEALGASQANFATEAEAQALESLTTMISPGRLGDAMNAHVLGMGQTWENVTSDRAYNVSYTNTTGRTIGVAINKGPQVAQYSYFYVDDVLVLRFTLDPQSQPMLVVVPPGSTYRLDSTSTIFAESWVELR